MAKQFPIKYWPLSMIGRWGGSRVGVTSAQSLLSGQVFLCNLGVYTHRMFSAFLTELLPRIWRWRMTRSSPAEKKPSSRKFVRFSENYANKSIKPSSLLSLIVVWRRLANKALWQTKAQINSRRREQTRLCLWEKASCGLTAFCLWRSGDGRVIKRYQFVGINLGV